MYTFSIHKDAIVNFNRKALTVVELVSFSARKDTKQSGSTVKRGGRSHSGGHNHPEKPDLHVGAKIGPEDIIGEPVFGTIDQQGNAVSFEWRNKSGEYSISGNAYLEVRKLARQLLKISDIGSSVARKTVESLICGWVKKYYSKKTSGEFMDYFCAEAGKKIHKVQIWTPIHGLCIQKSFKLGNIKFISIERTLIDEWEKQSLETATNSLYVKEDNPENLKSGIGKLFEKRIRPIQGYAAAVMEVEAEDEKAKELLLYEANRSLSLFRIFTGLSISPVAAPICALWGARHIDSSFIFRNFDGKFVGPDEGILSHTIDYVPMGAGEIDMVFQLGLRRIHEILISENRTELENAVLESAILYSKCTTVKDPADKLIYILVGLESMLLKDSNESIVQNISERIAFLIGHNLEERRTIVKVIKKAYELRSRFLHHGASVEDLQILQEFMIMGWKAELALIGSTSQMKIREELLSHLDDLRLS